MKLYRSGVPPETTEQGLLDRAPIVGATPGQDTQGRPSVAATDDKAEHPTDDGSEGLLYVVDRILDHMDTRTGRVYKVLWEGYTSDAATWEPAKNLTATTQMEYWERKAERSNREEGSAQVAQSATSKKRRRTNSMQRARGSIVDEQSTDSVISARSAAVSSRIRVSDLLADAMTVGSPDGFTDEAAESSDPIRETTVATLGDTRAGRTQRRASLG